MLRFAYDLLAIVAALVIGTPTAWGQTNYYWNGAGAVTTTASWGQNLNGTGTAPANFATSNQLFSIQNGQSATHVSSWVITGTYTRLAILFGGTFQTDSNTNTYTVSTGGNTTFIFNGTGLGAPTLTSVDPSSVFRVTNASFTGLVESFGNFGHLEIQCGTGAITLGTITTLGDLRILQGESQLVNGSNARTWTIGQDVKLSAGATWKLNNGTAIGTANISGTLNSFQNNFQNGLRTVTSWFRCD